MLGDSHSTKPSSSIVGTSALGLSFLYSGVSTTPNCRPASMRSYRRPSSSAVQRTFFTFTELVLPQIFSIASHPVSSPRRTVRRRTALRPPSPERVLQQRTDRRALDRPRIGIGVLRRQVRRAIEILAAHPDRLEAGGDVQV